MVTDKEEIRVQQTVTRKTTLKAMMRWFAYLWDERDAIITGIEIHEAAPIAKSRRLKDTSGRPPPARRGRPRKQHGRKSREQHARDLANERSRRYRARKKAEKAGKDKDIK